MKWEQMPLGPLQTNCYLIANALKECLVIDPGSEGRKLIQHIQKRGLKPIAILLTHAHFDHIGAVDEIRDQFKIPVYIHRLEKKWLSNPAMNGSIAFMSQTISAREADHTIDQEDTLTLGSFSCQIYETPGHSPGSISFYFKEGGFVVSGDALFAGSIGRTDLPQGDHGQLIKSIHQKLLTLPEDTIVLPGHGQDTTIELEMESNPYLNGF
ncbi:MBL fold metallo-hydrolase [Bacillus idriensis]|uniref:MBL fold metallo-hydrolase n=1 Tax=Metabacillus idriensis TaxID=324768 RepID=A0A6I2MFI7_9BACI|nr:MBL fold metallo-hydrolase [Metabacillus idriensis]MRX57045.1 MBL fold metallo-hydrolase [Metabacillus idriensis]